MAATQNFRSAIGGFNREDVARYLEYMNSKHQNQVNQLNTEIDALHQMLETQPAEDQTALVAALQEEMAQLQEQLRLSESAREELENRLAETELEGQDLQPQLEDMESALQELASQLAESEEARQELASQLAESQELCQSLEEQLAEVQKQPVPMIPAQSGNPLDAYRRAQSIEQDSRTQAELMYFQATGVLGEATAMVDSAAGEITALTDQVVRELTQLQVAVSGSKQTLQDAAAMMKAIRPNR